ncbi:TauD/TfdA family dioxygenase [Falsiruegeria mediterranea]|uniref:Gamma-butyrobetaine dioxygenase n=1 Tax=Falsiruegeria mediterranea M17 TaxID=1200281 RepID=A0A2R8C3W3_9RHOB|nr:TauD/TfdA family dioxygenase [Falsiruegeria mediterranea]SPJ27124.1 Gamma-butyrobetaine dioxygenase [Falsiruegeria mediterranea M17]
MSVTLTDTGLRVALPDGEAYFNAFWLRDNCASSFDAETRERVFDICALDGDPVIATAWADGEALVVDWQGEDHQSRYSLDWLMGCARGAPRTDPASIPRALWRSDKAFKRFDRADLDRDQIRCDWAPALIEDGVAIVEGLEDSDQALTDLANLLGDVRPSVTGSYFDVQVHVGPVNLAFTAAELELHTDTPAEETPPGVQFLHCRANSVEGGDSLFLDGAAAAEDFRKRYPDEFELLATVTAPFYYEHDAFDWRARQRVIELDVGGAVSGLTVSQHMADVFDMPQELLDRYYPAFVRFMRWLRRPEYLVQFRLNAGECIIFDNHRIVHGRAAYSADSGQRHLRGCYIDRGELRSTYRTLYRKTGQTAPSQGQSARHE